MNAFFAAVEQRNNKKLQGKPIAITNGGQGSVIITCSYEARAFGIHTGMKLRTARMLCPKLIHIPATPQIYAEESRKIMKVLETITPDIEVFSIDEAFLDITHCQKLFGTPEEIGLRVRELITETVGLPCSVGISGDKTTAKYAANCQKPNGLTIIHPDVAEITLANVPVTELCGIGPNTANFLAKYGVLVCGDMKKIPISVLAKRCGNLGRRIWYMCQGLDPAAVMAKTSDAQSMGHGKVIPPGTTDREVVLNYFMYLTEKLSKRLRANELQAQRFFIGIKNYQLGWFSCRAKLSQPSANHQELFKLCKRELEQLWHEEGLCQLQITALDPQPVNLQGDLFNDQPAQAKQQKLDDVIDKINAKVGADLKPARMLQKKIISSPIAPAWQPSGPRKTI